MKIIKVFQNLLTDPKGMLFSNLGARQTIAKNTGWLTASEGVTMLLKLILFIYIARILGAENYGKFAFALSFVSLFAVFFDPGIYKLISREFSQDKEKEKDFAPLLTLKMILGALTLLIIFFCSFFITDQLFFRKIVWILAVVVLSNSLTNTFYVFFSARQKMQYQAILEIFQAFFMTGVSLAVLFFVPSILNLSLVYLASTLFTLVPLALIFNWKILPLRFFWDTALWKDYLVKAWPIAALIAMGSVLNNIDSTMMGALGQVQGVGWYNAAQKVVNIVLVPAGIISVSFFPAISKCFVEAPEKFQRYWNYYLNTMIFFALPLVLGGLALARKIIDFVYDPSYFPAIFSFNVLLLSSALGVILIPFNHVLFVNNRQDKIFLASLFGVITSVVLNVILIPRYSLDGAAVAALMAFAVNIFFSYFFSVKLTSIKPLNIEVLSHFLVTFLAGLGMYLALLNKSIALWHVLWQILAGIVIFLFLFLCLLFLSKQVKLVKHKFFL